jgi:hypothetical protein
LNRVIHGHELDHLEKNKKISQLESENRELNAENKKLEEKNQYLKSVCDDLELIVNLFYFVIINFKFNNQNLSF